MMKLAPIAFLLLVSGCATLDERDLEIREYRNQDWKNRFVDYRSQCQRIGGRTLINAHSGPVGRDGIPRRGSYYTCSKRLPQQDGV